MQLAKEILKIKFIVIFQLIFCVILLAYIIQSFINNPIKKPDVKNK